jgi:3-oxoacyl-[acyl-carrier protein] reductase
MTQDLSGKAGVVTGSSRGIGRAIALGLASRGASVAADYLKNNQLAGEVVTAIQEQGRTAVAVQADLSRPAEVTALFDRAEEALGPLDVVFAKPLIECTEEEDYERLFAVNVKGQST